ncbi:hypothetical protein [Planktosalinus lacus]|uniref:Uncharacterized protein n=1 Tax=Planktosalinus lacus TaxID=1526573 RepID=A0A8J2VC31_9FLAO|nr:hypothetical protein [Planktosalinus lacus]GGD98112.1 hypothetical protein GCM10011312_22120 [Planktosalinus lacus]
MIENLTKNWNITRLIYLAIGVVLLIHTIMDNQFFGILLGSYITLMGLFGFGCAAGSCSIDEK